MTKLNDAKLKRVSRFLESIKVFTLNQMVASLSCSIPTARLKLKQWQAYTSYNQNGRYYAMAAIPRFDDNGLWHYKTVSFSKYGNLKNTIVELINASASGLTGNEIGNLVRLRSRSFLHHFREVPGIHREKTQGVYVYYSDDTDKYRQQIQNRSKGLTPPVERLSDADAVVVLAALIKHHGISREDIMQLAEVRDRGLSEVVIGEFLDRHGLLKKTPITKP